jgi:hypothetical protein
MVAVADERVCAKCGAEPAGPGGVLCPSCVEKLERQAAGYWQRDTDPAPTE